MKVSFEAFDCVRKSNVIRIESDRSLKRLERFVRIIYKIKTSKYWLVCYGDK